MRIRRLAVEFGQWERPWVGKERVDVVDRVEYCDEIEEGG